MEAWTFVGAQVPGGKPPKMRAPEFAFAGKSNVGKSSVINRLTRTSGLARTSRTPGRTQQINFFARGDDVVFADLPGYGFARVPASIRAEWKPLVEDYLRTRERLIAVVVIVDIRRGLGEGDEQLLEFATACERHTLLVASKLDKLGAAERQRNLAALRHSHADVVPFSSVTGEGERELWQRLVGLGGLR